jgi:tetratricopeptide (TPR) repeat protein
MKKRDQRRAQQQAARKEKIRQQKAQQKRPSAVSRTSAGIDVTPESVGQAMTEAVRLHHADDFSSASRIYRQVLQITPDHTDALSSLAMIEAQKKRPEKAVQLLQKAISLIDDNAGYYMNLGSALTQTGATDDAATAYLRAIELAPTYPDPYYNLGDLYLSTARPDAAIAVFDACIAARGRDFHALAYKAHALRDANNADEAALLLDRSLFIKRYKFEAPQGYTDLAELNATLAHHVSTHRSTQANVRSTVNGDHTGELLGLPLGPMSEMADVINEAIAWYVRQLPELPDHPFIQHCPPAWHLTAWGVVLKSKGHERSHIHPNGWLSGVFYVQLPQIINEAQFKPQGWLEFGRPTTDLHVKSPQETEAYKPEYGSIILFPSYFYHGTIPFKSKENRICISFDAEPIYE